MTATVRALGDGPIQPGDVVVIEGVDERGRMTTAIDFYRPPRPRGMSPVSYFRLYGCAPRAFERRCGGWYYCHPAHCRRRWRHKERRDAHLSCAYAAPEEEAEA